MEIKKFTFEFDDRGDEKNSDEEEFKIFFTLLKNK
jgi:hypothetical protein